MYTYGGTQIALIDKGGELIPIYNSKYIIKDISYVQDNMRVEKDMSNYSSQIEMNNGKIWIDNSYQYLIFLPESVKDSIFIQTFLYSGEDLEHFELVYQNPEMKLYKIDFD